jgi:antitoxin HicB
MKKKLNYYMSLPYRVEIRPLPEDEGGGYYAHFVDFGLATAHGDGPTIEEAIQEARISLELTLETMLEQGLPIPEPNKESYSGRFNVRLPKSLHRKLAKQAEEEEVSLNQFVTSLLAEGVGRKSASS